MVAILQQQPTSPKRYLSVNWRPRCYNEEGHKCFHYYEYIKTHFAFLQHWLLGNSKMRNKTLQKLLFLFCLNFSSQDNLVNLVTRILAEPLDHFGFGAECQIFSLIRNVTQTRAFSHPVSTRFTSAETWSWWINFYELCALMTWRGENLCLPFILILFHPTLQSKL